VDIRVILDLLHFLVNSEQRSDSIRHWVTALPGKCISGQSETSFLYTSIAPLFDVEGGGDMYQGLALYGRPLGGKRRFEILGFC